MVELFQTVEIWLDILKNSELSSKQIKHRLEQALTLFHYLAIMTYPVFRGEKTEKDQEASAEQWLEIQNLEFLHHLRYSKFQIFIIIYYKFREKP